MSKKYGIRDATPAGAGSADKTVEYEVVKCGTAGHTIRGAMSTSGVPLGMLIVGQTVQIAKTVSIPSSIRIF